ncbi:MAG: DUF1801 domain-containing protein [Betaproteobacteria bacterium]|nr:DUF1801 domain-containing protein [Betaproteobacteria bacterium]
MPFETHEDYFAECTAESRDRLASIQREVERRVPGAVRCIAYQMPAFRQQRVFFYFAAFKKHVGIYPPVTQDAAIIAETAPYRGPKGNLSFPHGEELPLELIGRIAEALARQYSAGHEETR